MADENLDVTYLINLYNGHQAIAERAASYQLQHIHVRTKLDERIIGWLNNGKDVILTGNPGDGKTHLLRYLNFPANVEFEMDASQKKPEEVLQEWQKCREKGFRFVLAINHAPLRSLAEVAAKDPVFNSLSEMILTPTRNNSTIANFIIYNDEQVSNSAVNDYKANLKIQIVDLSQREILTEEVISSLLSKLYPLAANASCSTGVKQQCGRCPLHDNAQALANSQVQKNLAFMLSLVARRGFHATMRDLVGMLAYILTGGTTCDELWRNNLHENLPDYNNYDFYNLLFQGRSPLFDAIRRTFDPGQYSDPEIDLQLWSGDLNNDWIVPRPTWENSPINNLIALRTAKRRYFFEHSESVVNKYRRMVTGISQEFMDLLNGMDSATAIQNLIEKINLFYAPLSNSMKGNYRDRLYLWNQHRYSIGGQLPGYVAMRSLSSSSFQIYHPKLNPLYEDAVEVRQDHLLFAVRNWMPGDAALRVDWEMFKALWDAKQGMAIEVQPYSILRRLDLFLRSLGSEAGNWSSMETIKWGDYRRRNEVTIKIERRKSVFQD
jgi:hypothetical protein